MRTCTALLLLSMPVLLMAADAVRYTDDAASSFEQRTVESPGNRVAVLELYTSEGCSSCPPADRFLSSLRRAGISDRHLIPMAFHVTYWDYIGWSDRFASKRYDQRQRDIAYRKRLSTIYTPQFILSGDDYRRYASFEEDIRDIIRQPSQIDIKLSIQKLASAGQDQLVLKLRSDVNSKEVGDTVAYIAILEDDLSSDVSDGENEGEILSHDYVVRRLLGPFTQDEDSQTIEAERKITLSPEWKITDLSIVAFVEDISDGEVLQAVRLNY